MAACADTGTVVNLHIGSSGTSPSTTDDAPPDVPGVLFFAYAITRRGGLAVLRVSAPGTRT